MCVAYRLALGRSRCSTASSTACGQAELFGQRLETGVVRSAEIHHTGIRLLEVVRDLLERKFSASTVVRHTEWHSCSSQHHPARQAWESP